MRKVKAPEKQVAVSSKPWKVIDLAGGKCEDLDGWYRMLRRACVSRKISAAVRERFGIVELRHKTDGITTAAVVTLREVGNSGGIVAHGYGTSVRTVGDEFREERGANKALRRAFDSAAAVITHRVGQRQKAEVAK